MTRWARGGTANKKKPLEASSWKALKDGGTPKAEKSGKTTDISTASNAAPAKTKDSLDVSNGQNIKTCSSVCKKKKKGKKLADVNAQINSKGGSSGSIPAVSKNASAVSAEGLPGAGGAKDGNVLDLLLGVGMGGSKRDSPPPVKLLEYIKKDRRREARRVKRAEVRQTSRVCFNCRESGHDLSTCPQIARDIEQGTGICFKCGSTEHAVSQCRASLPAGKYPFAKCFICKETGHLSRACPDNPRGLYPNGGCCSICESVEHFRKDCPELQKQQGIQDVRIATIRQCTSLDADDFIAKRPKPEPSKSNAKVVKF